MPHSTSSRQSSPGKGKGKGKMVDQDEHNFIGTGCPTCHCTCKAIPSTPVPTVTVTDPSNTTSPIASPSTKALETKAPASSSADDHAKAQAAEKKVEEARKDADGFHERFCAKQPSGKGLSVNDDEYKQIIQNRRKQQDAEKVTNMKSVNAAMNCAAGAGPVEGEKSVVPKEEEKKMAKRGKFMAFLKGH